MMFGREPRLPVDVAMGITLDEDTDDFIKSKQEIFGTAYNIASRKIVRLVQNKRNIMIKEDQRKHQTS